MHEREYHFIDGPRDGQKIFLKDLGEYYDVLLQPEMRTAFHPDAPVSEVTTIEKFLYRRLRIQHETWVFIPASWFDRYQHIHQHVIEWLVRGYMGNRQ